MTTYTIDFEPVGRRGQCQDNESLLTCARQLGVGNAAGMGARLALISLSKRAEAHTIASRVHYIELASSPNFMQTFIQASYLGQ